jgi:16S rRNA (adenine(1408)-N(1))-methyltransferase
VVVQLSNSTEATSKDLSNLIGEGVVIDIGTGDGVFVYQSARENPRKFYIGIDPSTRPLAKISEKIHRKPAKGGAPNVLFIQAAIADLPTELNGVADEVHIHFPWGSLLKSVVTGDVAMLKNVRQICNDEAVLEVVVAIDPERDQSELNRLNLPPLSLESIDNRLSPLYEAAGFRIVERGSFPASAWPRIETSWAKRLKGNPTRPITYLIAHPLPSESNP